MKIAITILSGLIFAGCSVMGIRTSKEPDFRVLKQQDNIQIRQYSEMLVAETEIETDYEESSSIGFKRLAGYIFGKNTQRTEIAMTAPVLQEKDSTKIAMTAPVFQEKSEGKWIMSFVLPSDYTLETAPLPLDDTVSLKTIPGKKVASLKYSGFLSEEKLKTKSEQLISWLNENGYSVISEPRSAGYDPPWTIPFLRRNEVLVDIR